MVPIHSVSLTKLVEEFNLVPLHKATDFEKIAITVDDISSSQPLYSISFRFTGKNRFSAMVHPRILFQFLLDKDFTRI